ncbi:MAG: hypothetical protein A3J38_10125 [Gammaproteobacteria bacterium RIFCSPHIGHO2_12_FULL_45_9]|nr:MAG: hypothetical protein A3J38_10125 [Gammaproteobacteria bacterium RIFCSPHIGHO2_12_FULL_45_9]
MEGDRIIDVRGPAGRYVISNDTRMGAVFVEPTQTAASTVFSLFLSTEKQQNYLLQLKPCAKMSDSIVLKPIDVQNAEALQWESTSPYVSVIVDLIRAMVQRKTVEGYTLVSVAAAPLVWDALTTLTLQAIYRGAHLEGRLYTVRNSTDAEIHLSESLFYRSGDRAVALQRRVLAPHQSTYLYKVVSYG